MSLVKNIGTYISLKTYSKGIMVIKNIKQTFKISDKKGESQQSLIPYFVKESNCNFVYEQNATFFIKLYTHQSIFSVFLSTHSALHFYTDFYAGSNMLFLKLQELVYLTAG